jgi:flagellin
MSISLQTNIASLVAQENLSTNSAFQTRTITRLTSGFRINQSGDDAAGLAVANKYRSSVAELTQGVLNINDGISSLQIADGGLNNITTMLDRLKTLATQSASSTFTGDRSNINVEYQQLVTDITRQASNVGLNSGGQYNTLNNVYIGGGGTSQANAQVQIDLSGSKNAVDSASLGLTNTSVLGGGTELTGNSTRLDAPGAVFLSGSTSAAQSFSFNLVAPNGTSTTVTAGVDGSSTGITKDQVLSQLNGTLNQYGITAQVGGDGQLQFGGGTAFTVTTGAEGPLVGPGINPIATATSSAANTGVYSTPGATTFSPIAENLTFQNGQQTAKVALTGFEADGVTAQSLGSVIAQINTQISSLGIYAVQNTAGTGISFQSLGNFTASTDTVAGVFGAAGAATITAPVSTGTSTGNALAAITSINAALSQVGNVQSEVGAGQNKLAYAMDLANSQITNFSAAQSHIRDADVALEAANLTKAQVLQQASIAAMAQANQAPQAVLSLLK